jgi:hypothetical protein
MVGRVTASVIPPKHNGLDCDCDAYERNHRPPATQDPHAAQPARRDAPRRTDRQICTQVARLCVARFPSAVSLAAWKLDLWAARNCGWERLHE